MVKKKGTSFPSCQIELVPNVDGNLETVLCIEIDSFSYNEKMEIRRLREDAKYSTIAHRLESE